MVLSMLVNYILISLIYQPIYLLSVRLVPFGISFHYPICRIRDCLTNNGAISYDLNSSDSLRVLLKQKLIDQCLTVIMQMRMKDFIVRGNHCVMPRKLLT